MRKEHGHLKKVNEIFNIKYSSFQERVADKLTLSLKNQLLLSSLSIIFILFFLLIKFNLSLNTFWSFVLVLLFAQFIGGVIYFPTRKIFYDKYLPYKIRVFNKFLVLPKKYYLIRMGTTGNWKRLNIIVFFEEIESYETTNGKLIVNFKPEIKNRAHKEKLASFQKLSHLIEIHEDLDLPKGSLMNYPFLNSYSIDNLSDKQIIEIENILNKKQIIKKNKKRVFSGN